MTADLGVIPPELRQQLADRLAELDEMNRLMRQIACPSERGGRDDQADDDMAATR